MDAEQGQLSPCILAAWQPANRPKLLISFVSSRKHSQYISGPIRVFEFDSALGDVGSSFSPKQSTLSDACRLMWCSYLEAALTLMMALVPYSLSLSLSCLSLRQLRVSSIRPMGQARERLWQGEDMIEQYWTSFVFSLVKVCYGFLSSYVDISMYCVCFRGALLFIARFLFQIGLGILGLSQR